MLKKNYYAGNEALGFGVDFELAWQGYSGSPYHKHMWSNGQRLK